MQLKKLPLGARHWHSACFLSGGPFSRAKLEVPRKFKSVAALLGFLIAISGAVSAQNRTTKRRIDFNASNKKRGHNKERLVMIVTREGILSLLLPAAVVAGAKQTTNKLASLTSADFQNHTKGTLIYEEACSGMVSGDGLDACWVWLEWFQGKH
jgi:hypothetical protein